MYVAPSDLKRVAGLAGRVGKTALELLDLAESSSDAGLKSSLLRRVAELLDISQELNQTVLSAAGSNDTGGIAGLGARTGLASIHAGSGIAAAQRQNTLVDLVGQPRSAE